MREGSRYSSVALCFFSALAAGMATIGPAATAQTTDTLEPNEIRETFGNGVPFTASINRRRYTVALMPDGTSAMIPKTGTPGRNGTWALTDEGLCITWGRDHEQCFTVRGAEGRFDLLLAGKVAATWFK